MNKRQRKKYLKTEYPIDNIRYCINRESCDEDCTGCSYPAKKLFRKLLKKENLSWRGWKLAENPISGVYIFYNSKKNKEITLYMFPEKEYEITVSDPRNHIDVHMNSIREALHSPYQNIMYDYEYRIGTVKEREKMKFSKRVRRYRARMKRAGKDKGG